MQESWKEERKIWSGIPFSKPSQSVKPCLLFSFLFFPMIPSRYHGKNGPGKNGRGADWLCRWPARAGTGEGLTGCDGGQHGRAGHGRVPAGPVRALHRKGRMKPPLKSDGQSKDFFFIFPCFPMCSHGVPSKFLMGSQYVPQVHNAFLNMFCI